MIGDRDGNKSNPYRPGPLCCEACCFSRGEHADWCEARLQPAPKPSIALEWSISQAEERARQIEDEFPGISFPDAWRTALCELRTGKRQNPLAQMLTGGLP